MKKLLFIYNPRSGKGRIKNHLFDIIDIFAKASYDITVHPTQSEKDCSKTVAQQASLYELVVVSGGDGTLNEAVSGMLELDKEERVPIGYIPAGTMNDFASGNNIPKLMTEAAAAIVNGKRISYDIGSFNGNKFVYVAAFGAFTEVSYGTPQATKNILGPAAYFMEGLKRLPRIEGVDVRITTGGGQVIEEEALLFLIMNSTSIAGFEFGEFYHVNTNDGLFEIVVIPKSTNLLDFAAVVSEIKNGERNSGGVHVITTDKAVIEIEKPVSWTLDGEYGGETERVEFEVLPNAVEFIV